MGAMDYGSVAQWYDFYATVDVDFPFYLQEIDAGGDRVLELACGTGRVSVPLLEAGINLTCVDMAVEMLDVLRRKLAVADLQADVVCQDVRELDLGQQFDVVIMPFTSFMELADRADQLKALRAIRRHLSPRGRFLCALHNPARRLAAVDGLLHLAGRAQMDGGQTMLLWSLENHDAASHTVSGLQTWEIFDETGRMVTKYMLDIRFSIPGRQDFQSIIAEAGGLQAAALYGDFDHSPYDEASSAFMIWDLRRSR